MATRRASSKSADTSLALPVIKPGSLDERARMRILDYEWPFPISVEGRNVWRNLLDVAPAKTAVEPATAARKPATKPKQVLPAASVSGTRHRARNPAPATLAYEEALF